MFFIGVFGVETKEKNLGIINNLNCKNCSEGVLKIVKSYNYFHIFFIPLFKWKVKYYALCNTCGAVFCIPIEKGEKIERGQRDVLSYWDLSDCISYGRVHIRCNNCGKTMKEDYEYCPYCGEKLK